MSVLTHSNNINFEVRHRVLSLSVYTLLSLSQAMLNMSILSTNDQGKSFWELVYDTDTDTEFYYTLAAISRIAE